MLARAEGDDISGRPSHTGLCPRVSALTFKVKFLMLNLSSTSACELTDVFMTLHKDDQRSDITMMSQCMFTLFTPYHMLEADFEVK